MKKEINPNDLFKAVGYTADGLEAEPIHTTSMSHLNIDNIIYELEETNAEHYHIVVVHITNYTQNWKAWFTMDGTELR